MKAFSGWSPAAIEAFAAAKASVSAPMTDCERLRFRQQLVDVRAADERRQASEPQLELNGQ